MNLQNSTYYDWGLGQEKSYFTRFISEIYKSKVIFFSLKLKAESGESWKKTMLILNISAASSLECFLRVWRLNIQRPPCSLRRSDTDDLKTEIPLTFLLIFKCQSHHLMKTCQDISVWSKAAGLCVFTQADTELTGSSSGLMCFVNRFTDRNCLTEPNSLLCKQLRLCFEKFTCEDLWSVRGRVFMSDLLFGTSLKPVPHFFCLLGVCSRGLQAFLLILPCAEVCDLNRYLWGDVSRQKPITAFTLFIPQWYAAQNTRLCLFISFFHPEKSRDKQQGAHSLKRKTDCRTHLQTLLWTDTASQTLE